MILSVGEILVDVFLDGENKSVFAGGAPFNVASNIAHFGGDVSFYGAVGNDDYGRFLLSFAKDHVNNLYLDILANKETTQALVTLIDGERSFRFVRDNGADYHLDIKNLYHLNLADLNIIHIGSLMLPYKEGKDFFDSMTSFFKDKTISFDVNYREDIFKDEIEAKNTFIDAIKKADVIKFTSEELKLLTGEDDILTGLKSLLNDKQIAFVTLGKEGSIFYSKNKFIKVPTQYISPLDTTGAGDAFYSYVLYSLDKGLDLEDDEAIRKMLKEANLVGGLATTKKGAIDVVPSIEELEQFLKK